jgi:hypothetical protein
MASLVIGCLLALALITPAAAAKPQRGCPDGFDQTSIADFRMRMNSAEFYNSLPPEGQALAADIVAFINTDEWLIGINQFNKNGDDDICAKQGPINKGHYYGWVFNVVDNTSNH